MRQSGSWRLRSLSSVPCRSWTIPWRFFPEKGVAWQRDFFRPLPERNTEQRQQTKVMGNSKIWYDFIVRISGPVADDASPMKLAGIVEDARGIQSGFADTKDLVKFLATHIPRGVAETRRPKLRAVDAAPSRAADTQAATGGLVLMQAHGQRRWYDAGKVIARIPGSAKAVYCVVAGTVAVHADDDASGSVPLTYLGQGEFFVDPTLSDGTLSGKLSLVARTGCEVIIVVGSKLRELVKAHPDLFLTLLSQTACRLQKHCMAGNLVMVDAAGRLARELLRLANGGQGVRHRDGVLVRATHEELGRTVNCSPTVVAHLLQELQSQGLIERQGNCIVVIGAKVPAPSLAPGASPVAGSGRVESGPQPWSA